MLFLKTIKLMKQITHNFTLVVSNYDKQILITKNEDNKINYDYSNACPFVTIQI